MYMYSYASNICKQARCDADSAIDDADINDYICIYKY